MVIRYKFMTEPGSSGIILRHPKDSAIDKRRNLMTDAVTLEVFSDYI
jgi:hypothetical protein